MRRTTHPGIVGQTGAVPRSSSTGHRGRRGPPRVPTDESVATPLRRAVDRIGDRWMLLIVGALLEGPRRFGELGDELGVAPNILTRRLRDLEADGVIVATPYNERPVRLSYELTAGGRELAGAIALLADWGARRDGWATHSFHETCGTPLEMRPWCQTCERVIDDRETSDAYEI